VVKPDPECIRFTKADGLSVPDEEGITKTTIHLQNTTGESILFKVRNFSKMKISTFIIG
jgi:hypothetical protein